MQGEEELTELWQLTTDRLILSQRNTDFNKFHNSFHNKTRQEGSWWVQDLKTKVNPNYWVFHHKACLWSRPVTNRYTKIARWWSLNNSNRFDSPSSSSNSQHNTHREGFTIHRKWNRSEGGCPMGVSLSWLLNIVRNHWCPYRNNSSITAMKILKEVITFSSLIKRVAVRWLKTPRTVTGHKMGEVSNQNLYDTEQRVVQWLCQAGTTPS